MEMEENIENKLISECEGRIKSDIAECKRSKLVGNICQIKLNDCKKINDDKYELIIEFKSYFSLKFIFDSQYPISPPSITFNDGNKIKNIFDENNNVLVETIKKENWNKSIWLSTLIFYIELLISRETGENSEAHSSPEAPNQNQNKNQSQNENQNNQNNQNSIINKNEKYGKRNWKDYLDETNENYKNGDSEAADLEKNLKKSKE